MVRLIVDSKSPKFLFLLLSEFINRFYGILLALLVPIKFGVEDFGRIQFLVFCLTGIGGVVGANSRSIFTKRRSEYFIKYRLRNYFHSVSILISISLLLVFWTIIFLSWALHKSIPGLSVSSTELGLGESVVLFMWAEALLFNSNLTGVLFSLHKIGHVGFLNSLRIIILCTGVLSVRYISDFVHLLVLADLVYLIIGLKIFYSNISDARNPLSLRFLLRLLKNTSNHLLLLGNASIMLGLWYFQFVISTGESGARNLGIYSLMSKYIGLISIVPGVFLQYFLILRIPSGEIKKSLNTSSRGVLFLFGYTLIANSILFYGLNYSLNLLDGISNFTFIVVVQFLSFSMLMNSSFSSDAVNLSFFRTLGISDLLLGTLLIVLCFLSNMFGLGFVENLCALGFCYTLSSSYLFIRISR